jgi:hypothetical protein
MTSPAQEREMRCVYHAQQRGARFIAEKRKSTRFPRATKAKREAGIETRFLGEYQGSQIEQIRSIEVN